MKERLLALQNDIKVAITGIGSIGRGLVYQSHITPGIKPVAIADIHIEKALACARWLELDYVVVDHPEQLHAAMDQGKLAVTDNGELLGSSERIDVFIEASNALWQAARHVEKAILHNQHVVMMNYEAELMFGPYLLRLAREKGVVYTCADGDQPTVIKGLIDELELWGFDLVMAGNIKGYLDRYTNPTKIKPEADKRNLDHKMCSSYTDGSKVAVEMAVLANALNLRTAIPGMYGHRAASVHDIFDLIDFKDIWKDRKPVVEYLLGAEPKGGVFAIGYTESKFQQYTLEWFPPAMGPGPFYLFYRPYHLGHIEAMACVAEAYLDGSARLQPNYGMRTNVFAYAKKDLKQGDLVDGMGGYAAFGLIENMEDQAGNPGLPICIAEDLKLKRAVRKDERINLEDVAYDPRHPSFDLYFKATKI